MRKGVEKSQAILALRDGFQDYFQSYYSWFQFGF